MKRRHGSRQTRKTGEKGMVTVEMAFAALGIGIALVLVAGLLSLCVTQIRCVDAASEIARLEARDDHAGAQSVSARLDGADVRVEVGATVVTVHIRVQAHPWGAMLPPIGIEATARAARE
ncbi:MAG: hypothetical protein LBN10_02570 [Propionibacteriaceae bacterium]|nr:hypothetical protein [Propionibacteriaceae bacterium]